MINSKLSFYLQDVLSDCNLKALDVLFQLFTLCPFLHWIFVVIFLTKMRSTLFEIWDLLYNTILGYSSFVNWLLHTRWINVNDPVIKGSLRALETDIWNFFLKYIRFPMFSLLYFLTIAHLLTINARNVSLSFLFDCFFLLSLAETNYVIHPNNLWLSIVCFSACFYWTSM